jgi:mono/diheme cytochrome c family protein
MRKFLKWIGILIGVLLGLALFALAAVYYITEERINRVYDVPVAPIAIPTDTAALQRGRHLVTSIGLCGECHGEDFSGQVFDEGPLVGKMVVSNLTGGKGGIGKTYTDGDWVRAIRHGIAPDGKSLILMPSSDINFLSDSDLAAVIAYLKSLPPVENQLPKMRLGPMGRLFLLQEPFLLPAAVIDHAGPWTSSPEPGVTREYGEYLASICKNCHGQDLSGGDQVGAGLNLTPAGNLADWTFDDFKRALRFGLTPSGRQLDPLQMPWKKIGLLSDQELEAIWMYLQSLPAIETLSAEQQP